MSNKHRWAPGVPRLAIKPWLASYISKLCVLLSTSNPDEWTELQPLTRPPSALYVVQRSYTRAIKGIRLFTTKFFVICSDVRWEKQKEIRPCRSIRWTQLLMSADSLHDLQKRHSVRRLLPEKVLGLGLRPLASFPSTVGLKIIKLEQIRIYNFV